MGDGSGLTRRITAGDDDTGGGIVARDATDRLPRALIGAGGDRTGIHDDKIGCGGCRFEAAASAKVLFDAQRIRLVHATAECDDRVAHWAPPLARSAPQSAGAPERLRAGAAHAAVKTNSC